VKVIKKIAKGFIFLLLGLICSISSHAQSDFEGTVTGVVIEQSTGEPMEFVNVLLLDFGNKNALHGGTTDVQGMFYIENIPTGQYYLELSYIGFEEKETAVFTITKELPNINLETIGIEVNSNLLDEVEVKAEKSIYQMEIDRKVYNVEKDIMSQTSSATEILQNIPSITVDVDGQVSLRGSSNITFFINGRPSALMRANSVAALQSMPANTIERIEVITNPSAKYKPDGLGGIINIVLKKETEQGSNGTLMANIGTPDQFQTNATLNYSKGDFNVFGSYGYRFRERPKTTEEERIDMDGEGNPLITSYYSTNESKKSKSHTLNTGVSFLINENSYLELSGTYYNGKDKVNSFTDWRLEDGVLSEFSVDQKLNEPEEEYEFGIAFEHEFEEADQVLTIELNHAKYDEVEDNIFSTDYTLPFSSSSINHYRIEKGGPLTEFSLEYARSIGEESELEMGYIAEFIEDDIKNFSEDFDPDLNSWITDPNKTNNFIFNQNIHAFYTTFGRSFGEFSLLAGLRAEQALTTSNLISNGTEIPNDYFKVYPTLHLAYEINDEQEVQLNYSKRIKRADSDEHNPFPEYKDPRNREAGNPKLKPEQVHSLELGYQLQKEKLSFIPTLYYRYLYDAFEEIQEIIEDTILHTTYTNLSSESSAGLELVLSGNLLENLGFTLSSNIFYKEIDASNIGITDQRSNISWNAKLATNWNFRQSTYIQANAYYRSGRLTTQGENQSLFLLNLGLRQDILRKRGSLVFTVSDVFASLEWEKTIDTPDLYRNRKYKRNRQIYYLGFTYRFGQSVKDDERMLNFEDKI
jgi:outer membrane receptor protein involved in Fe transport